MNDLEIKLHKAVLPQEYEFGEPVCAVCKCCYINDGQGTACPPCREDIMRECRAMYEDWWL